MRVSPASQVEKGMAVYNKSLRLHYGSLQLDEKCLQNYNEKCLQNYNEKSVLAGL